MDRLLQCPGRLDVGGTAALHEHLDRCDTCQKLIAELMRSAARASPGAEPAEGGYRQLPKVRDVNLVRLFTTPADLFIVQHVGPRADLLIKDIEGKVSTARSTGKEVHFLVMDGQDTARVLHAYGKL